MSNKKKGFVLFISFLILGIVIAMQFRSTFLVNKQKVLVSQEVVKLRNQLDIQHTRFIKLQSENDILESAKKEAIEKSGNGYNEERLKRLVDEKEWLRLICGLTDVQGEGVILTLNDGLRTSDFQDINEIIIHDKDLLKIVNELHKAGAQAISINDERITAATKIFCAGPAIKINNSRCAVPYTIIAIGDSGQIYRHLQNSSIIKELMLYRFQVDIKESKDLLIKKTIFPDSKNNSIIEERITGNEANR